ncbi:MAG TPA: AAA family ATPase [Candidatus Saccharimonadales bacterium]|nr:AAA family ATPase [Candidatus Saccharimonadales bacterium]
MKLTRLSAQNLLSFDTFELDLDPQRTVIVGPNGSGKTNVTRLLTLVGSALVWANREGPTGSAVVPGSAARILEGFYLARHLPDNGGRLSVRVAFELTEDWERDLLVAFLRAALLWSLSDALRQGSQHSAQLAAWAMSSVTVAGCADLFSGTLIAEHPGIPGMNWEVGLEFAHGPTGATYRWVLQAPSLHSAIVTPQEATSPRPGLIAGSDVLARKVLGTTLGGPALTSLPPLPPFSLDFICPKAGEATRLVLGERGQYLDLNLEPYKVFLDLARLPQPVAPAPGYSIATVLDHIYSAGLVLVGEQLRGVGTWGTALPRAGTYSWEELANPPVSREPHLLPLRLFRLKTGTAADKGRYLRIQEGFRTLAPGRQFDLQFEAVSGQQLDGEASAAAEARIEVIVAKVPADQSPGGGGPSAEFPIQLHGAGTWEALILAEALNDAADRVVVLDEPATTLHPTWQRGLATQLDQSDGQILLVTHSPDLLRIRDQVDLSRVVRLTQRDGATLVQRLTGLPQESVLSQLLRELALSVELRSCLFARAVVLLEGETELGVLPRWFARCAADTGSEPPDSLDLGFYQVGGDAGFAAPLALLAGLGIPWAVICDGAAFDVTHQRNHIFEQVKRAGAGTSLAEVLSNSLPAGMDAETFGRLVATGRNHGVLTVASGWTVRGRASQCSQPAARAGNEPTGEAAPATDDESFEAFLDRTLPGARDEAKKEAPRSKVRQGLWISDQYAPPKEIGELYQTLIAGLRAHGLSVA